MTKSYFSTSRYVIIDYGFCVLKGLIQLRKKGVFPCAVTKRIRYWPARVPGKDTVDNFWEVEVGETDAIQGTFDDVIYDLLAIKDPNYVIRMMSTGGGVLADETCKETVIIWKENGEDVANNFKYKLTFDWHFSYCHAVDDHNNPRNSLPSIEDTWVTDRGECWVFAFILAISEVNEFLILHHVVYCGLCQEGMPTLLDFLWKLAWKLINNIYIR